MNKLTNQMVTNSFTPFDLDEAAKEALKPPQTFTGLAGSSKSNSLTPELYINWNKIFFRFKWNSCRERFS